MPGPADGAIPVGPNSGRKFKRDLLPLPSVHVDSRACGNLSRKCRQREGKRIHFQEEVSRTVSALNSMYGAGRQQDRGLGNSSELSSGQQKVLEFIEGAVDKLGPPSDLSGPEALEVLRVSGGYMETPTMCPLGSFDPAAVSLPSEGMDPVPLELLWGDGGRREVEDFTLQRMLSPEAVKSKLEESGVERVYQDPAFHNPKVYADFIKRLHGLGLVEYCLERPHEQVGLFVVKKKNNKQRLIMDCRRSNCHFAEPLSVQLATGDSLSRIEVEEGRRSIWLPLTFRTLFIPWPCPSHLGHGLVCRESGQPPWASLRWVITN